LSLESSDKFETSPTVLQSPSFLLDYYHVCREELVQYGYRFDHNLDTAEALFEACHDKICKKDYPQFTAANYLNIMKRSMGNLYKDQLRRDGYLDELGKCKFPEQFSPKPQMALDERVCRNEELGFLRLALGRMSLIDQDILLELDDTLVIKSYRKYQAIKRLEKRVIEVIAEQKEKHLQEQR
jgi:hypothetical protein